jgi:hypothetical protein
MKVGQFLFAFHLQLNAERLAREPLLVGGLGVACHLGEGAMAGNGFDLVDAASGIGEPRRCRLAQPMKRAVRQTGIVAAITPPIAKAVRRERRAVLGHQESQVAARHRCQCRHQLRVHRNKQRPIGLLLAHGDGIAVHMLPAHAQHVALALRRIEAQGQRQPCLAADGVALLELRDLALRPTVMAFALASIFLDTGGRVAVEHALGDGVTQDDAQCLEQVIRRFGLVGLGTDDGSDVLAVQTMLRRADCVLGRNPRKSGER